MGLRSDELQDVSIENLSPDWSIGPNAEIDPPLVVLVNVPFWILPLYAICPLEVICIVPFVIAAVWGSIEEGVPCASNVNENSSPVGVVPLAGSWCSKN